MSTCKVKKRLSFAFVKSICAYCGLLLFINALREKKMNTPKTNDFAITETQKESIGERLRLLIGSRSVRAAAADWGLSFSTLNNYLTRGTEPSLNVAIKVASLEGVTVEWLATGVNHDKDKPQDKALSTSIDEPLQYAWQIVYDSLDKTEVEALLRLIHKKGVNGILNTKALDNMAAHDFLQLSETDQQRVLRLAQQIKEGASEDNLENELTHPTHKQAG